MSLEIWIAFVLASTIVLVIPGPTILTVISYSVAHGRKANGPLVAGVALGDATALCFSLLGLGSLLAASAMWFSIIKWCGGLYLLYLGIKLWRSGVAGVELERVATQFKPGKLFKDSYIVTALNPKSILFFVAFLPQFIDHRGDVGTQMWILATTFVVLAAVNAGLYGVFASSVRRVVTSQRSRKVFNRSGGGLLMAAGVWALFARRAV